jgi:hypothetical protein
MEIPYPSLFLSSRGVEHAGFLLDQICVTKRHLGNRLECSDLGLDGKHERIDSVQEHKSRTSPALRREQFQESEGAVTPEVHRNIFESHRMTYDDLA